jgi:serine protein kinase
LDITKFLDEVKASGLREFAQKKLILSFREFLELFAADPVRLSRSAPQYLADVFEHFGSDRVPGIGGRPTRRHRVFDAAFDAGQRPVFGQEVVGQDIAARVRSFAQAGKANRLILIHGPNGSSKTSLVDCIFRAMEHYSHQEDGALYSFNWVFVDREDSSGRMGFERTAAVDKGESLAHIDGKEISCRIPCEMRDNPIFLVPPSERAHFLDGLGAELTDKHAAGHLASDALRRGAVCPKCRQIYDTLLAAYGGDWQRVMRHVQVERFFVSLRYREGAVSIQPQGVIDAGVEAYMPERGPGLPTVLQGLQIFAPSGDLIDANRGMVEYSDVLKRHMEANKYLLHTAERGTASLPRYEAYLDLVMVATANEQQLTAFKAHPDFNSFRGRLELVPCPYLLEYRKEARIYADFLSRTVRDKHVAPHVAECAALWAVLTRLRQPDGDRFEGPLAAAVRKLKPIDKARLYDSGRLPTGLEERERRELSGAVAELPGQFRERVVEFEGQVWAAYEGAFGASPREMQLVLADAAAGQGCLTPLRLLAQIEELVKQTTTYDFLRLDAEGDYLKPAEFIETVREDYAQTAWR